MQSCGLWGAHVEEGNGTIGLGDDARRQTLENWSKIKAFGLD